jgi:hypothetical protein
MSCIPGICNAAGRRGVLSDEEVELHVGLDVGEVSVITFQLHQKTSERNIHGTGQEERFESQIGAHERARDEGSD